MAGGHIAVIWLLLEKDADVDTQGGEYGSTLQVALAGGHTAVVWLLLEKDVDVNVQGGHLHSRWHRLVVMQQSFSPLRWLVSMHRQFFISGDC